MKKFLYIFLTLFLVSCSGSNHTKNEMENKPLDYDIIENRLVTWGGIFSQDEEQYLTYIFSETCGHCSSIKEDIIKFYLSGVATMYFVKNPDDDKFSRSPNKSLIGISSSQDLKIQGVPCLLEIQNHAILNYHYGKTDILNFLIV